jgi:hypothetical protein
MEGKIVLYTTIHQNLQRDNLFKTGANSPKSRQNFVWVNFRIGEINLLLYSQFRFSGISFPRNISFRGVNPSCGTALFETNGDSAISIKVPE